MNLSRSRALFGTPVLQTGRTAIERISNRKLFLPLPHLTRLVAEQSEAGGEVNQAGLFGAEFIPESTEATGQVTGFF